MAEEEAAPLAPLAPPALPEAAAVEATVSAPPVPEGPPYRWEDAAGGLFSVALVVGGALSWYRGHGWFEPTREALVTSGFGLLSLLLLILRPGPHNERVRRIVTRILGGAAALLCLYVAATYYLFHRTHFAAFGVVGHLKYLGIGLDLSLVASFLLVWSSLPTHRPAPPPPPRAPPVDEALPRSLRWGVPLLLFLSAFAFFHAQAERPAIIDFDEAHYVRVALNMTDGVLIDPQWGEPRPFNFEHPPMGKYLIALGYGLYGEPHDALDWNAYHDLCDSDNPDCRVDAASWRLGSELVGSLGVVGIYWLGLRLFRSVAAGFFAAALLLLDNFYYLHSRIALLDIFAIGPALLAFGVYLGPRRWHPWAGSVLIGLAAAGKHTALFLVPPFFLLVFLTSRHANRWMRLRDALLRALFLPFAVYVLTYLPYFVAWTRMHGLKFAIDTFFFVHQEAFTWTYRAQIDKPHPYISQPWTWIPMRRPVFYFVGYNAVGNVGHIYALGNPFLWWAGSVAVVYATVVGTLRFIAGHPRWGLRAFWQWLGRPFAFGPETAALFAALLFLSAYGPFFLLKRDAFNFYFLIAAPFFSLLLGGYLGRAWTRGPAMRLLALAVLVLAGAVFAIFHPVVAGTYISEEDFQFIMHLVPKMTQ